MLYLRAMRALMFYLRAVRALMLYLRAMRALMLYLRAMRALMLYLRAMRALIHANARARRKRDGGHMKAKLRLAAAAAAVFVAAPVFVGSVQAADPDRGLTISRRWCASCHVVAADQKQASVDVPSFADIAKRRTEARPLAVFLSEPHGMMPNMNLTQSEIGDIVAYIRALAPGGDPSPAPVKPPDLPKNG